MSAGFGDNISMALFCDFENIALGVRDARFDKFDIALVLERLLLKGSIVVKKAYCDWERYKGFKAVMHEANFELIEIPHVRQSGKNSADIRLVVDALDLCYTKAHVDTFVIISGDSDFSPLVSKLRENAKQVIGVGVKQSTSDLLIANCDEFIFYDDLVREQRRDQQREVQAGQKNNSAEVEKRRKQAIALALETFEALVAERDDDTAKVWASMLKQAIKRRRPDFNESYFGFKAFGSLLEEAQRRGLLELGRDEKSGTYIVRPELVETPPVEAKQPTVPKPVPALPPAAVPNIPATPTPVVAQSPAVIPAPDPESPAVEAPVAVENAAPPAEVPVEKKPVKPRARATPKKAADKTKPKAARKDGKAEEGKQDVVTADVPVPVAATEAPVAAAAPAKPARRSRKKKEEPAEPASTPDPAGSEG